MRDHETLIARADGDFAAENEIKGFSFDSSRVEDGVKHVLWVLNVVQRLASLRVDQQFLLGVRRQIVFISDHEFLRVIDTLLRDDNTTLRLCFLRTK